MKFAQSSSAAIESNGRSLGEWPEKQAMRHRLHADYACGCEPDEQTLAVESAEEQPTKECDCILPSKGVMRVGHC